MVKTVWLSYDLGVRGDYEGLFEFLAGAGAKECGSNLGVFSFPVKQDVLVTLQWQDAPVQQFQVQSSADFTSWQTNAANVTSATTNYTWSGPVAGPARFYRLAR